MPKFLSQYLPKIGVPIDDFPNFSFRQPPWGSVELHLHIFRWNADNNFRGMSGRPVGGRWWCWGWGCGSRIPRGNIYLKLNILIVSIPILASVRFRQLPSAPVSFIRIAPPHILLGANNYVIG